MFILADTEERCVLVTVYYVDISTSVSLGDIIEIPKPVYRLMDIEWRKEVWWKRRLFKKKKNEFIFRNFLFHHYVLIHQKIWKLMEKIGQWILMHHRLFHLKLNFKSNLVCFSFSRIHILFLVLSSISVHSFREFHNK